MGGASSFPGLAGRAGVRAVAGYGKMRPVEDDQARPARPSRPAGRPARGAGGRTPPTPRRSGRGAPEAGRTSDRGRGSPQRGGPSRGGPVAGRGGREGRSGADERPGGPAGRRRGSDERQGGPAGRRRGPGERQGGSGRSGGERLGAIRQVEDAPGVGEVLSGETLDELRATARPHAVADAARALADAVVALSEEGDPEAAVRAARAAKRAAPRAASVREALGIALYQAGDFRTARTELAAAQRISGRQDLSAMLADIERALGRPERAIAVFERVDRSKLEPDTAAELLLVAASAYGDLGQPASGLALIRRHARWPVELADHHLRLAYAEGALAEAAGDLPRARAAFARVLQADPDFHDAADRLERLDPAG
jgi:hypothetical protein